MEKIYIRNTIGWHITSEQFSAQFKEAISNSDEVELHINSPGGSVYMGWEMYNEVRRAVADGIKVKTFNNGLAASIASILFLSAEKENRFQAETSLFMIHNARGMAFGDEDKMKKEAEVLSKIGDLAAGIYARSTKTDIGYMKARMKEETWYKPKEASSEGFIFRKNIVDGGKPIDQIQVAGMEKEMFKNMPSEFQPVLNFSKSNTILPKEGSEIEDLTKISNSQIREKTWKNYLNYLV